MALFDSNNYRFYQRVSQAESDEVFIDLTPFIPLSLKEEGGRFAGEANAPLATIIA